jgi:predicted aspartyl protease
MNAAHLEIVPDEQLVPLLPERAQESARPAFVSGANRVPLNPSQPAGVTNVKLDVDPKFDKTNYQTEFMIEIEQNLFRIIADSGATLSGINLSVVKELILLPNMKPTEYTYRTSSGKVENALGTVEVSLRIGPIVVKTDMVVMPSGCGHNMLLGDELMTTLRADIMRSLKVVRFQVGDCITSVPMLP